MASDSFIRFRSAVLDDESLQERLRVIADWQTFAAEAVAVAATWEFRSLRTSSTTRAVQAQLAWLTRAA